MRVVASVEISRPASQVWAYVADYGNDMGWRTGVSQIRPSVPGPVVEGHLLGPLRPLEPLVTLSLWWTAVLAHRSTVTSTIATASAVSSTRQNSAMERTTTRLTRWW